ncbi:putative type VI secretion protein IcmF [Escherichia coli 2-427-07_S4_C1]|nr:putative type VI secretion protein IcmF [Escherichia coli 2-427-07_S4_C1]
MPRFKVSAFWLLILAWIFLLVWIWWKGPTWTLYEEQWLKPLANRWLATAAWGIIALMWLTVRVMKRLQQLEKMQKQQREEAVDPLSVELNAQQRYLDRWLLRLQRYLDNRRFLWQLPWYMVIGPAGSGKTTLLREGFPSDIIYAPEGARGAEQRLYLTPHVGKQAAWQHFCSSPAGITITTVTISPASPCLSRPKPLWTCRLRRGKMTLATCNCRF